LPRTELAPERGEKRRRGGRTMPQKCPPGRKERKRGTPDNQKKKGSQNVDGRNIGGIYHKNPQRKGGCPNSSAPVHTKRAGQNKKKSPQAEKKGQGPPFSSRPLNEEGKKEEEAGGGTFVGDNTNRDRERLGLICQSRRRPTRFQ